MFPFCSQIFINPGRERTRELHESCAAYRPEEFMLYCSPYRKRFRCRDNEAHAQSNPINKGTGSLFSLILPSLNNADTKINSVSIPSAEKIEFQRRRMPLYAVTAQSATTGACPKTAAK